MLCISSWGGISLQRGGFSSTSNHDALLRILQPYLQGPRWAMRLPAGY